MKNPRTDLLTEFIKDIKKYLRTRTLLTVPEPRDGLHDILKKYKISYGHMNNVVDVLILNIKDFKEKELEKLELKPRLILSNKELHLSNYKLSKCQVFTNYEYRLYERKDLLKIVAFPIQGKGAVLWYRIQLPLLELWKQYEDIDIRIIFPMNYYDLLWGDIIIIQRWFHGAYDILKYAKQIGKKVVVDTDDLDIYINPDNPLWHQYQVGNRLQEMKQIYCDADLITVTTDHLKQEMKMFNSNVEVLRNKIDIDSPVWKVGKVPHDGIIIGWLGGSTHYYDIQIIRQFTQQICNRFENVRFLICGYIKGGTKYHYHEDKETGLVRMEEQPLDRGIWDDIVDEFRSDIGDKLFVQDGTDLSKYGAMYASMDIVVVPLRDNRFCRGKSELKAIEAGTYSIPIVASDVAPYQEIIQHGKNGFLVKKNKPKKWISYLSALIQDEELRKKMGSELRNTIEKKYDVVQQKDRLDVYRRLVK